MFGKDNPRRGEKAGRNLKVRMLFKGDIFMNKCENMCMEVSSIHRETFFFHDFLQMLQH